MSDTTRLLWVEDEEDTIKGTLRRLRRRGYDIVVCKSAEEALQKLSEGGFARVIVDSQIPESAGLEPRKNIGVDLIQTIIDDRFPHSVSNLNVMLLTAQTAAFRRQLEFSGGDRFLILEKPGSLMKIEEWLESEDAAV